MFPHQHLLFSLRVILQTPLPGQSSTLIGQSCRHLHLPLVNLQRAHYCNINNKQFEYKKIAVLAKTTRFEFERRLKPDLCEDALRKYLHAKGSDYDGLFKRHEQHHRILDNLLESLEKRKFDVKLVDRYDYGPEIIDWADVIFSAGGDGTFLLAASKVVEVKKPIIGINTDPQKSEGYLCLPKKFSEDTNFALDLLLSGKFRKLWRQRIRVTMSGKHQQDDGVELNKLVYHYPEYRFIEHVKENEEHSQASRVLQSLPARVLPVRALNEVFIGESLSARR